MGSPIEVITASVTCLLGTFALACGMQGWLMGREIPFLLRIPLVAGAILLIKPGIYTDLVGIGLLVITYFLSRFWKRKDLVEKARK